MRLFVALELPDEVLDVLEVFAARAEHAGLRDLPRESLHVTLAFLGQRPDEEAGAIAAAVEACAAPVGGLRLGPPAWLPPRHPRVLAVDLDDTEGACGRVQACVSDALVALRAYTPETRPFRPHVTVARVKKGARVETSLPEPPVVDTFAATALTLYRSHLGPKGARYEALTRKPLT